MSPEIMSTILNSAGTIIMIAGILAVCCLADAMFFTSLENQRRPKRRAVWSIIFSVLMLVVYKIVVKGFADSDFKALILAAMIAVSVLYCVITLIVYFVRMVKGGADKTANFMKIFMLAISLTAILFIVYTLFRHYDLVRFADELIEMQKDERGKQYPSLAILAAEGYPVLSNNIILGFALAMSAIASVGVLALVLLKVFKDDKHVLLMLINLILVVVFMALPVYSASFVMTPEKLGTLSDKTLWPETINISGMALVFGFKPGAGINFPLLITIFGGLFGVIVCQVKERCRGIDAPISSKLRVVKAIFMIIVGLGIYITSMVAVSSLGADTLAIANGVETWASANELEFTVGVSGLCSTGGIVIIVLSLLSILKQFVYFLKRFRCFITSGISALFFAMYLTATVYEIPNVATLTGLNLINGVEGVSNPSILFMVGIVSSALAIVIGLFGQAHDLGIAKFFRRIASILYLVGGVIIISTVGILDTVLTDRIATIRVLMEARGFETIISSNIFVTGLLLILSSVALVGEGWVKFFKGLARFLREGFGKYFFAALGAIVILAIYAFVLLTTTVETQILVNDQNVTEVFSLFNVIMGTAIPTGTYGPFIRYSMIAVSAFVVLGALFLILSNLFRKKINGFQTAGFWFVLIASVYLMLIAPISSLVLADGMVTYSVSLALIGLLVLVVAIIAVYKVAIAVFKGTGEFLINNIGLTAAILSFILIILYMMGIL